MYENKKLIIFDLDGTLAESKSSISDEMSSAIIKLLNCRNKKMLAVISGAPWKQFKNQLLSKIQDKTSTWSALSGARTDVFYDLYLLPTCGSQLYVADNGWDYVKYYSEQLLFEEKVKIYNAWAEAIKKSNIVLNKVNEEIAEDRESQITFSMCGQNAPLEIKKKWDPNFTKRKKIIKHMKENLQDFEIRFGGTTSIDVTKKGIDKSYGINKLLNYGWLDLLKEEILFIGDALHPGGNDYPVKAAGFHCIETTDPAQTIKIINTLV